MAFIENNNNMFFLKLAQILDNNQEYQKADVADSMQNTRHKVFKRDGVWYVQADYEYREYMKILGFKWSPTNRLWVTKNNDVIKSLDSKLWQIPDDNDEIFDNKMTVMIPLDPYRLNIKMMTDGIDYRISGPGVTNLEGALRHLGFQRVKNRDFWVGHDVAQAKCFESLDILNNCLQHQSHKFYYDNFDTPQKKALRKAFLFLDGLVEMNPSLKIKDPSQNNFFQSLLNQIKMNAFISDAQYKFGRKFISQYISYIPSEILKELSDIK